MTHGMRKRKLELFKPRLLKCLSNDEGGIELPIMSGRVALSRHPTRNFYILEFSRQKLEIRNNPESSNMEIVSSEKGLIKRKETTPIKVKLIRSSFQSTYG